MKKLILLFGILMLINTISCSKDDKTPCSELNIHSQRDLTCEEVAKQYDCSCK